MTNRTSASIRRSGRRGARPALAAATVLLAASACGGGATATKSAASAAPSGSSDSAASSSTETGPPATVKDVQDISAFCGSKKVTIAYVDDNAGANPWRKITRAEFADEVKKCPNITNVVYTDGQGSLQKTISDLKSVTAQRVDGVVLLLSDYGKDLLPAARQTMRADIPVVGLLGLDIGGEVGKDYVANVVADEAYDAQVRVDWLAKVLGGKGNIIHVGGTPGNPLSNGVAVGIKQSLVKYPGLQLLTGTPVDTGFSATGEQQNLAGVLSKFPNIDGVQNECGTCSPGGFRAFAAANRQLVPWTSDDNNEVSCTYYDLKKTSPKFEIFTTGARNFLSRVALHKVLAKAEGVENNEPTTYSMPVVEDSTDPLKQPKCDREAPPGAIFSSLLTRDQVIDAVR